MGKTKGTVRRIQSFMDSPKGRTFTNYIYSWGAAIVILGTLFKLTHIAGANLMLFVGMGAEVIVFFFSAFERPYELAEEDRKEERAERRAERESTGDIPSGATVIIGGSVNAAAATESVAAATASASSGTGVTIGAIAGSNTPQLIPQMDEVTEEYIEKVRALNETIKHISDQTEALGRNMEEMETLSRNLTAVNAMYEIQLRGASNQLNNIDTVNDQTKKMAEQIEELNNVYSRMLEAMTANMNKPQ
ncbi:MAG: gliding motility protein GldL [Bacteroidaceae bacterium]|nr:gliding motility protein GldL [Bacteroidaceae bacterium]